MEKCKTKNSHQASGSGNVVKKNCLPEKNYGLQINEVVA